MGNATDNNNNRQKFKMTDQQTFPNLVSLVLIYMFLLGLEFFNLEVAKIAVKGNKTINYYLPEHLKVLKLRQFHHDPLVINIFGIKIVFPIQIFDD